MTDELCLQAVPSVHDRVVHEYWPTPAWCVHALLRARDLIDVRYSVGHSWCEPCVGDGAIVRAVTSFVKRRATIDWYTADIRDVPDPAPTTYGEHVSGFDFRSAFGPRRFDVVITNPPFSLAREVAQWARPRAEAVALLQRVNWLGSKVRGSWWRQDMPDVYVMERRPSFCGGKTDGCEYAWFVWQGEPSRCGKIEVIECE